MPLALGRQTLLAVEMKKDGVGWDEDEISDRQLTNRTAEPSQSRRDPPRTKPCNEMALCMFLIKQGRLSCAATIRPPYYLRQSPRYQARPSDCDVVHQGEVREIVCSGHCTVCSISMTQKNNRSRRQSPEVNFAVIWTLPLSGQQYGT